MVKRCEVVIVGCGPAGNTLAYRLARQGRKVLLLDKERLPRVKVCGGGLSRKTLREIPYSLGDVVEAQIGDVLVARGGERVVDRSLPGVGVTVQRETLDALMAQKAEEAGARLAQGCRFLGYEEGGGELRVSTTLGEIHASVLVGADGAYSSVGGQLYPSARPTMVPAIEALVTPRPGGLEALADRVLFDVGAIRGGYGWIFPKRDHLNVGLYRFLKTKSHRDLKRRLMEWIEEIPLLRDARQIHILAHSIPVRPVGKRLSSGRVVLVGDAGGLAEAVFGEGVHNAVRSAHLAAETILGFLGGTRPLSDYDRLLGPLRRDLAFAWATASFLYRLPHAATFKMVRSRVLGRCLGDLMRGRTGPGRCFFYAAGLAPMWLLEPGRRSCSLLSALEAH